MSALPWVCPKCGRVYGPGALQCLACNSEVTVAKERRPDGGEHHQYTDRPDWARLNR